MATVTYPGVYVEEISSGVRPIQAVGTSTAAFVGQAEKGVTGKAVKVYNFTEYQTRYGGFLSTSYLSHSVYQFFNNGGSQCYIIRVAGANVETANIVLQDRGDPPQTSLTISATSPGAWGNRLAVEIEDGSGDPASAFNLLIYQDDETTPIETFEDLSMDPGQSNFVATVTLRSQYVRVTVNSENSNEPAVARPRVNPTSDEYYRLGDRDNLVTGATSARAGSDGDPITDDNIQPYVDAFPLLNSIDDVSLLVVPGVGSSALAGAAMNYCANLNSRPLQDMFFIGDMGPEATTVDAARGFMAGITPKNSYGAIYTPWVKMVDLTGRSSEPLSVPPSGYVAGLYARTDARRGVWKAPAGTEAALAGATGLEVNFTDVQQGNLNPRNINVIRQFAASGIVLWGTRTVTSDAEWTYIPVRRLAIMLRVSIYNGLQWAVFEPNDEGLWAQIRLNIRSFMTTLFRQGAFQGSTPSQAFFVKCDSETTPQTDIDRGIVNVLVGFAPLKPAEFVVVKISQKAGQNA